jgi:hypothetical protein
LPWKKSITSPAKSQVLRAQYGAGMIWNMDVLKYLSSIDQSYIWANLIWSTVASGYLIYGWKQKMLIPFVGGLLMTAVAWLMPWLIMTLVSIGIMVAVWWLVKEGY